MNDTMQNTQAGSLQHSTTQLSINTSISSSNTSPETLQGNIAIPNDRRMSFQTSPVNLASSLNNLTLEQQSQPQLQQPELPNYTIRIRNVPSDISLREAYCIFAFAKDFVGLDISPDSSNMPIIYARFQSLSSASTYSQLLESNQIFGPSYPFPLKAEILDTSMPTSLSMGTPAKRPSIGNQRSRFLFSDPFSNEAIAESTEQTPTSANGVGKSLLLMESQQDAREYDQLVRDQWSQPSAPRSQQGSATSFAANGSVSAGTVPFTGSQPQTPGVEWDRRRQSSSFFNQSPLLAGQISNNQIPPQLSLGQPVQGLNPPQSFGPPSSQGIPTSSSINSSMSMNMPPNSAPMPQQLSNQPSQTSLGGAMPPSASTQASMASSNQSSQVDLSILARVPPPANPADQNPPCNTLYVGNLPPDATEAELRQLFAPQRGFRRLSFRTKQPNGNPSGQSSHSHGPMCFVEFEDVAHATRALAELYGRTLPRPGGVPGKGGIRLSFSKNPLGVRGPGQRRTSGFGFQAGFKP